MIEAQVREDMNRNGINAAEVRLVPDGRIHRFRVPPSRKKNGWYWFVERGQRWFGVYGDWAHGTTVKLGADSPVYQAVVREKRAAVKDEAAHAAHKADLEWAGLAATGSSAYLKRKGVPAFGVRFGRGFIAVPMWKLGGGLVGLQKIYDDGRKRYTFGCSKKGACFTIPGHEPEVIVEGYATGAAIHMATGFQVTVAFDAGNLLPVAKALRKARGPGPMIVAGDNDHETEGNPGEKAAIEAAAAIKARWVIPYGQDGTDWNDLMLEQGALEVYSQLIEAL